MMDMAIRRRTMPGFLLLCLLVFAWAMPGLAQESMYSATVPVADTSSAQRNQAFAQALDQVLTRVTGHSSSAAGADDASTYVMQYHYQRAPAGSAEPFVLFVKFAPSSIRHLAGEAGDTVADEPAGAATADDSASAIAGIPVNDEGAVWVSNLHSALDFADALAALRSAPGVDDVTVQASEGDGMLLDVHTSMPLQQTLVALQDDGRLVASDQTHAGATASLRWVK